MKTKEEILEELFYKPETQDWYKPVLKAMETYAQQFRQPPVSCWAFNLNECIKVKIYDKGYQLLAENHNKYLGVIKNWEKRDADYYKSKADKNGYTHFQAWDFIQEFGSVTRLGMSGYYLNEIQIDGKYLSPCR